MLEGGAEYPGFVIITSGEGNYGRISKTNTNRRLVKGDYLWLDLGARYKGYWSDFCRSGEVGSITKERDDLQNTIHEVTMRAAEVMKPGMPVADVARACGRELERAGFEATFDCGRMGHGMGLMSTEPPSVTIYDDTILQEGMIINLEPGIVTDIGVFDLEENFVITKDGFETLSGGSRKLHLIK
jgi:Xaa-Pro aminopeptidase